MKLERLREIRDWAFLQHKLTNHKYDNYQYSYHLQMVADSADMFYIPSEDYNLVQAACYCHDLIEDARQTYNDVKSMAGEQVAEIVYALTNEKGRNRAERANDKYYDGIRNTPYATFVKLCDRIANMTYSIQTENRMAEMYRRELPEFLLKLNADAEYPKMAEYLRGL